jgi:Protein of unknown function (DUF3631)
MSELTALGAYLHRIEDFVRRYVVVDDDQAAAIATWVAHTHAFAAAVATPYLSITSAEMESGKTRLLEVLRPLVANPWFTGRTTAAALTRKIAKASPTLLLDEFDATKNGDKEFAEVLRGVLNSGYRAGGAVTVCVGQGANFDVRDFPTFCPKAIAGIGALPDTVASRSIPISLKRRLASEPIERFRERKARALGEAIADGIESVLMPLIDELTAAEPHLPEELSDRQWDVWEPLLALSDAAGGEWPERARAAAVRLSDRGESDEATLGVRLLADCRDAFGTEDRIATVDLLEHLHGIEDAPWADWYGKEISARKVADLLRRFGIKAKRIRIGEWTPRGYLREAFEDAWTRYVPVPPVSKRNIRNNRMEIRETASSKVEHEPDLFHIENPEKPHEIPNVPDVPLSKGGDGENGGSAVPDDDEIKRLIEVADEAEREARRFGIRAYDDSESGL